MRQSALSWLPRLGAMASPRRPAELHLHDRVSGGAERGSPLGEAFADPTVIELRTPKPPSKQRVDTARNARV